MALVNEGVALREKERALFYLKPMTEVKENPEGDLDSLSDG